MRLWTSSIIAVLSLCFVAGAARAQCPPGSGCTEYLGRGVRGSYFRILIPANWDGDIFLVNHGLELDPLTIAPHNTCRGDARKRCSVDADCARVGPGVCNKISLLGFEQFLLPAGKAVGASTFSETSWAPFHSRFDLKAMVKFLDRHGPGRPKRIIVTGFSGGGAVTVDATMRLHAGKMIHGAIPLCPASAGGLPTMDTATDIRLVYDYLCSDVPGGSFDSLADAGDPDLSQLDLAFTINACLGWLAPSADPIEAAAQTARREAMFALTRIPGPNFNLVHDLGFSVLAMGQFVYDPQRLHGRRPGWNEGLDYASALGSPEAAAFNTAVQRLSPGPGRHQMALNPTVDFTRGIAREINYPILSFAGTADHICTPEFQRVFADAAAEGGKDQTTIWGSTGGHCVFTPFELEAVVKEYLAWLDTYRTASEHRPSTATVLARCLALPGSSPSQCNFDTGFSPAPLSTRVPPRSDWPASARTPAP